MTSEETLETMASATPGNDAGAAGAPPRGARPWGFWATLGFSLVVMLAFVFVQVVVVLVWALASHGLAGGLPSEDAIEDMASGGAVMCAGYLVGVIPCSAMIVGFAALRHRRYPLLKYLGLGAPTGKAMLGWLAATLGLVVVTDGLTYALGRPIVPPDMVDTYQTCGFVPLLVVTLVVAAPVLEELLFRGFMLEGIRHSPVGTVLAVILTSALWGIIHLQYDAYGILVIFVTGILLGVARLRSGNLWICVAMHALGNAIATAEVAVKVHLLG